MRRTNKALPLQDSSRFGVSASTSLSTACMDEETFRLAQLDALAKAMKDVDNRITTTQRITTSASGAPIIETAYATAVSQQFAEQRTAGLTKHASLHGITYVSSLLRPVLTCSHA